MGHYPSPFAYSMLCRNLLVILCALGIVQVLGVLYDGPKDILHRSYDVIIVGGTFVVNHWTAFVQFRLNVAGAGGAVAI